MKSKLKGITLLETVLYIGLFSIVVLMVINYMFSVQESYLRTKEQNELHQSMEFLIKHIDYGFEHAISINEENSTFNNDTGTLSLMFDSDSKQYYTSNGKLFYNGIPLTQDDISVITFHIIPTYKGSTINGGKINLILESTGDSSFTKSIDLLFTL